MDYQDFLAGHSQEHFWFKAKNDLTDLLITKSYPDKKNLKILNIGVGTGDDLETLNKFGINYVIDNNADALSAIPDNFYQEKKLADACALPYGDNSFDLAVAFDVFEHIENDWQAVSEVYRVLKKGGVLIFTVPAIQSIFSNHDRALRHLRRYNKKQLLALLSPFSGHQFFYWNSLLFMPIAIRRIINKQAKERVDILNLPFWLNKLFYRILSADNFLIKKGFSLPIGLTIAGFCYKTA